MVRTRSPSPGPIRLSDIAVRRPNKSGSYIVLSGHGAWFGRGPKKDRFLYTSVPEGTTITFYERPSQALLDDMAHIIEDGYLIKTGYYWYGHENKDEEDRWYAGHPPAASYYLEIVWQGPIQARTFGPTHNVPDLTLAPPDSRLRIHGHARTVTKPTLLSELLVPFMGNVYWAACQTTANGFREPMLVSTGLDSMPYIDINKAGDWHTSDKSPNYQPPLSLP